MHLKTDETSGVGLVNFLVRQILDLLSVDPHLDPRALGNYFVRVPLPVFEMLVRLQAFSRGPPASLQRLAINISRLSPFLPTGLDLNLRAVDPAVRLAARRMGTDHHSGVQLVVHLHFVLELKIPVILLR